jgi:hypothetical protein
MRFTNIAAVCVLLGLATQPIIAAETVLLYFGGKKYRVEVNAVLMRVCEGRAVQIVSPRDIALDGDPDRPAKLVGDDETFPLELVKQGTYMDAAKLVGKGETFPFDVELKGAKVSDAHVRSNGTWSMTVTWTSCAKVPKTK